MNIDRVLVLTPQVDGDDGISEVSRQVIDACAAAYGRRMLEVWTLDAGMSRESVWPVRSAGGSRSRLAGWSIRAATRPCSGLLVLALHLHLAPIALPFAMRGAQVACFFHGIEAWKPLRPRERASLAAAAKLLANSRWTADRFRAANPAFAARDIAICPLGVRDAPEPEYPESAGYALIVGRLAAEERYKGHDALIEIWPAVVEAVPDARLVIVGDGDDRARLEIVATRSGVADRIHFVGRVSRERLEGFYRHAAFFVMPSTGEGFGLAYLEAMRAGKACIAAPGAPAEVVDDEVTGLIVDPCDRRQLAGAITTLFCDRALRERLARTGAARVSERFLAEHFTRRLVAALELAPEAIVT